MAEYRIEPSPSAQSSCKQCGKRLAKEELRFGHDRMGGGWYHLRCAVAGRPVAAKRYAKEIALALRDVAPVAALAAMPRNAELEATLRSQPDDKDAALVYADWLQGQGHPWGEIIALAQTGNEKAAAKLFKGAAIELTGNLAAKMFSWRNGFIERATVRAKKQAPFWAMLNEVWALPAALRLRELVVTLPAPPELIAELCRRAPPSLKKLVIPFGPGLEELAIPSLEHLQIYTPTELTTTFEAILDGSRLPQLRRLDILCQQTALPARFLEALLHSKLLGQLEELSLYDNGIRAIHVPMLVANQAKLAHLQYFSLKPVLKELEAVFSRDKMKRPHLS